MELCLDIKIIREHYTRKSTLIIFFISSKNVEYDLVYKCSLEDLHTAKNAAKSSNDIHET